MNSVEINRMCKEIINGYAGEVPNYVTEEIRDLIRRWDSRRAGVENSTNDGKKYSDQKWKENVQFMVEDHLENTMCELRDATVKERIAHKIRSVEAIKYDGPKLFIKSIFDSVLEEWVDEAVFSDFERILLENYDTVFKDSDGQDSLEPVYAIILDESSTQTIADWQLKRLEDFSAEMIVTAILIDYYL